MKKVLQSSLLIVLFLAVSSPAKACTAKDRKSLCAGLVVIGLGVLCFGTAAANIAATASSASSQSAAKDKFPNSDIEKNLLVGAVTYGISIAAALVGSMGFFTREPTQSKTGRIVVGTLAGLAVVSSAIGMGFNGMAYHMAGDFYPGGRASFMIKSSIAALTLNVSSFAVLMTWLFMTSAQFKKPEKVDVSV